MTRPNASWNTPRSIPVLLCLLLSIPLTGCSQEPETNEVRDQANAECADLVTEMHAELKGLFARAELAAGDDEALLRVLRFTTETEPFRSPSPCFEHPSLAAGTPDGFRLELEASLSSMRADFDNAGRRREYDALVPEQVRLVIREKLRRVRELAEQVASSE